MFSPPRSPRTRKGIPCLSKASLNTLRTVDARLLLLARIPTICNPVCQPSLSHARIEDLAYSSTVPIHNSVNNYPP